MLAIAYLFWWALVGAILSVLLPVLLRWLHYRRKPDLLGRWLSVYQGIDEPPGTWVTEEALLTVRFGHLEIRNAASSHGYRYTASGQIEQRVYFLGTWESIWPGANAYGSFLLTVSAQGDAMYGTGSDPTRQGLVATAAGFSLVPPTGLTPRSFYSKKCGNRITTSRPQLTSASSRRPPAAADAGVRQQAEGKNEDTREHDSRRHTGSKR